MNTYDFTDMWNRLVCDVGNLTLHSQMSIELVIDSHILSIGINIEQFFFIY